MYYPDGVIDIGLDVINHVMFLAGLKSKFIFRIISLAAKRLRNYCIEAVCVSVCVSVRSR